jgi:hypothetical protein
MVYLARRHSKGVKCQGLMPYECTVPDLPTLPYLDCDVGAVDGDNLVIGQRDSVPPSFPRPATSALSTLSFVVLVFGSPCRFQVKSRLLPLPLPLLSCKALMTISLLDTALTYHGSR